MKFQVGAGEGGFVDSSAISASLTLMPFSGASPSIVFCGSPNLP